MSMFGAKIAADAEQCGDPDDGQGAGAQEHRQGDADQQPRDEAEHLQRDDPVDVPLRRVPGQLEPVPDAGQLVLAGQASSEPGEPGHPRIEDPFGEGLVQLLLKRRRRRMQGVHGGE